MRAPRRLTVLLCATVLAGLGATSPPAGAAAGSTPAAAAAGASAAAAQCPQVLPRAEIRAGMRGRGLTVTRGRSPQAFAVEVLGTLPGAIAPGRDLILIEVSDLAGGNVIAQGGGIWAGMSGSPVYVGGRLLGAIAYGFTAAPSAIGGVTPAEDMVRLLGAPAGAQAPRAEQEAARVELSPALQKAVRARGTAAAAATTLDRLPMPFAVSGLGPQRLARFQQDADHAGLSLLAYPGGARGAPSTGTAMTRPVAGGNFAAALSYGDVTAAAVGTTTAVCGNQALAFGHPFLFVGPSGYGANDATALTVVRDDTFGAFKLATLGAPFGTIDQDRLAAVRTALGTVAATTPVTTTITAVEQGRTRTGQTRVTDDRFLPGLAFPAVLASIDTVFDEIGDGTATTSWTIRGTRAGGAAFQLSRSDRWASPFDVAIDPAFDLALTLDSLLLNPYERVGIDAVVFGSEVSTVFRQLRIADARVSVDGGPFLRPEQLVVRPGALLRVRAVLAPFQSTTTQTVQLAVRVPAGTAGRFGALQLLGSSPGGIGAEDSACLLESQGCAAAAARESLDTLLAQIRSRPRGDDLRLVLTLESPTGSGAGTTRSAVRRLDQVVTGSRFFPVSVAP
jgi:SpoIVB peptidase S55